MTTLERIVQKVGVRDLKINASEIIRRMREEGESFEVTYRGETVGRIVPLRRHSDEETIEASLRRWQALIDEIAEHADEVSADETMREIRRDL